MTPVNIEIHFLLRVIKEVNGDNFLKVLGMDVTIFVQLVKNKIIFGGVHMHIIVFFFYLSKKNFYIYINIQSRHIVVCAGIPGMMSY